MPSPCSLLCQEYKNLQALKASFVNVYEKVKVSGDLTQAKTLKAELEQARDALMEKLWSFEALPLEELQSQYALQEKILEQSLILKEIPQYPLPNFKEIFKTMLEQRKILETKVKQGFTKLLLIPMAASSKFLVQAYGEALKRHYQNKQLFDSQGNLVEHLNTEEPVCVPPEYWEKDNLVYYPKSFNQTNHGGKTKRKLLKTLCFPGWEVLLLEDLPNLPALEQEKTIGDRKQVAANLSPNEYLSQTQNNPQYQNEIGLTPEAWLAYAMLYLQTHNRVLDDWQGQGKACCLTGSFLKAFGAVPNAGWSRDVRQANFYGGYPGARNPSISARRSVRVGKAKSR